MEQEIKDLARVDQLFERISTLIEQARRHVVNTVNVAEMKTRFEVGRYIFEDEQQGERAAYGQQILRNLSVKLIERFGNDWSYDTFKRCRQFYQAYEHAVIGATPLLQSPDNPQGIATLEDGIRRYFKDAIKVNDLIMQEIDIIVT